MIPAPDIHTHAKWLLIVPAGTSLDRVNPQDSAECWEASRQYFQVAHQGVTHLERNGLNPRWSDVVAHIEARGLFLSNGAFKFRLGPPPASNVIQMHPPSPTGRVSTRL